MSLLSKFISFFKHDNQVNHEFSSVYHTNDTTLSDSEPVTTETGTYDMYQSDINTTVSVEQGTLISTAEDISAVLESQSRRFGQELTI